jgi:O-acetyl-ADP-ribose deacetylase (regulator of RNase III)
LKNIVCNCLERLQQEKSLTSISFPAIGTGNLGFQSDLVARILTENASEFLIKNINANLTIKFVIYDKDVKLSKVFLRFLA